MLYIYIYQMWHGRFYCVCSSLQVETLRRLSTYIYCVTVLVSICKALQTKVTLGLPFPVILNPYM